MYTSKVVLDSKATCVTLSLILRVLLVKTRVERERLRRRSQERNTWLCTTSMWLATRIASGPTVRRTRYSDTLPRCKSSRGKVKPKSTWRRKISCGPSLRAGFNQKVLDWTSSYQRWLQNSGRSTPLIRRQIPTVSSQSLETMASYRSPTTYSCWHY